MSTKGTLTREQAIALVGEAAVSRVDAMGCEPTNRVQCDGDTRVEFAAAAPCNLDGVACTVAAYYYQDADDVDDAEDLSALDWKIEGYEVQ